MMNQSPAALIDTIGDIKTNLFSLIDEDFKLKYSKASNGKLNLESEVDELFEHIEQELMCSQLPKVTITVNAIVQVLFTAAELGTSLKKISAQATVSFNDDGQLTLIHTYRGLRDAAIRLGIIRNAVAVLVYEYDHFRWFGPHERPEHHYDPFSGERGQLRGGYCIATLTDGSLLVTAVKRELLEKAWSCRNSATDAAWRDWTEIMLQAKIIRFSVKEWPGAKESNAAMASIIDDLSSSGA